MIRKFLQFHRSLTGEFAHLFRANVAVVVENPVYVANVVVVSVTTRLYVGGYILSETCGESGESGNFKVRFAFDWGE